jgi:hypothetical protein
VCLGVCPNDVFRLVPRPDWENPSPIYGDIVMEMMANRIRSGLVLPLKKLPGHKYVVKWANDILRSGGE